jgi:hypothetical protein
MSATNVVGGFQSITQEGSSPCGLCLSVTFVTSPSVRDLNGVILGFPHEREVQSQTLRHEQTDTGEHILDLKPPLVNSTLFSTFSSLTWTSNLILRGGRRWSGFLDSGRFFLRQKSWEDETFEDEARG